MIAKSSKSILSLNQTQFYINFSYCILLINFQQYFIFYYSNKFINFHNIYFTLHFLYPIIKYKPISFLHIIPIQLLSINFSLSLFIHSSSLLNNYTLFQFNCTQTQYNKFMQQLYKEDIQCILPCKNKKGAIYIGNLDAARNLNTLKKYNIKAIISIAKGGFLKHTQQQLPNYLYIPAYDHKHFDLSVHFDRTYDFIQRHKKNSNVLVHCIAGVSRSVTIVIAYLMKKQRLRMKDAYETVRKRRPIINPNEGFISQLLRYQEQLNKTGLNQQSKLNNQKNADTKKISFSGYTSKNKIKDTDTLTDLKKSNLKQIKINIYDEDNFTSYKSQIIKPSQNQDPNIRQKNKMNLTFTIQKNPIIIPQPIVRKQTTHSVNRLQSIKKRYLSPYNLSTIASKN